MKTPESSSVTGKAIRCIGLLGQTIMLDLTARYLHGVLVVKTSRRLFPGQIIKRLLFCRRQYQGALFGSRWTQLRVLEFRIFFAELNYLRRRFLCSVQFFMHPTEAARYFWIWGFPLYKPDYMFKMFDKFHSVLWPNAQAEASGV